MNSKDIELLKLKDEFAFNRFYDRYHKLFFSIIYQIIKDFSTTEELVSDTFCKILASIHQYNGGSFKYWCVTICKNIANMQLRKVIQEREKLSMWTEEEKVESDVLELEGIQDQLLKDIKKIVDNTTYEIIILHLVQNLKFKEIAKIRHETTSSILGRYHRGIKLIRSKIRYEDYR